MKSILLLGIILIIGVGIKAQHHVLLKNGSKLECVVISMQDDTLKVYMNRYLKSIPIIEVSSIYFAEPVAYDGKLLKNEDTKTIRSGIYTIEYQMKDRTMTKVPIITNGTEKKGIVVIKVTIDRSGNVVKTEPGYIGSNTSDEYLLTKAEFAAKSAKFDANMKAPIAVEGTITIIY